jgi:hypothetical protein
MKTSENRKADDELKRRAIAALNGDDEYAEKVLRKSGWINPNRGIQQKDLVEKANIDRTSLNEWSKQGMNSSSVGGRHYPLWDFINFILSKAISKRNTNSAEIKQWNEMEAEYKAKEKRLKFEVQAGSFLPIEDVKKVWGQMITACKKRLLAIPRAMATRLQGEDNRAVIEHELKHEIHAALEELASGEEFTG